MTFLTAGAVALGFAWAMTDISGSSSKLESAAVAARPTLPVLPNARPIDADYADPGVLDYRSWKPEYDTAPRLRQVSVYHAALRGTRTIRHPVEATEPAETSAVDVTTNASEALTGSSDAAPATVEPRAN